MTGSDLHFKNFSLAIVGEWLRKYKQDQRTGNQLGNYYRNPEERSWFYLEVVGIQAVGRV